MAQLQSTSVTGSLNATGNISASAFTGSFTGSFTGLINSASFATTASAASSITFTPATSSFANTASAATSITFTPPTASFSATSSFVIPSGLPPGSVSSSGQINHNATTNYVANQHVDHTTVSITAGSGLSGGGDISTTRTLTLDTSSTHFITGSVSASRLLGALSSSAQVVALLPTGTVSSSGQISYTGLLNIPTGIVSSSTQINNYNVFATTGSNAFNANQTITGSLIITQNLTVLGSSSVSFISQSTLNIGTNLITVNVQNPSLRLGGLAVIDSGSSPQRSGSILFDSTNDQWIFVHQNTTGGITSSVLAMGPATFNNIGNETLLTQNRVLKGGGLEHIVDSQITDDGSIVSITNALNVGTSVTASAANITTLRSTSITGSVSGALAGTFPYGSLTGIPVGIVSNSGQISYTGLSNIPTGILSSSTQINALTNVSASFATTASAATSITFVPTTASYAANADLLNGLNSSVFATTGSNAFTARQIITRNSVDYADLILQNTNNTSRTALVLNGEVINTEAGVLAYHHSNSGPSWGGIYANRLILFSTTGSSAGLALGTTSGNIIFAVGGYAASRVRAIIDSSGNFGVGTTSPSALLHVSASGATNDLLIGSTSVPKLFVSGSGNIGIGTTTPSARLAVNLPSNPGGTPGVRITMAAGGTGVGQDAVGLDVSITGAPNFDTIYGIRSIQTSTGGGTGQLSYAGYFKAINGSSNIDNTALYAELTSSGVEGLYGNTYALYAYANNATSGTTGNNWALAGVTSNTSNAIALRLIDAYTVAATKTLAQFTRASTIVGSISTNLTATSFNTSPSSGIIGIDATTISINTNSSERWRFTSTGILQSNGAQTIQTSTGNLTIATAAGNGHILLIPHGTGNVGIGTTVPGATLHVQGAISSSTIRTSTSVNVLGNSFTAGFASGARVIDATSPAFELWHDGNSVGQFLFSSNALRYGVHSGNGVLTERLRINSSGNVGIGSSSPVERLHVQGNISASAFTGSAVYVSSSLGELLPLTSASLATGDFIYDTNITVTNLLGFGPSVYELIAQYNPNTAGSTIYRNIIHGNIYVETGWNGAQVVATAEYNELFRAIGSGSYDVTGSLVNVSFVSAPNASVSSEQITVPSDSGSWQLRIRFSNNSTPPGSPFYRNVRLMRIL